MMLALCFGIFPYAREKVVIKLEQAEGVVREHGGWQAVFVSLVLRTMLDWLRV